MLRARFLLLLAVLPIQAGVPSLEREMLRAHNEARAKLKLPALVWSDKLAEVAKNWAFTLLMRSEFMHRPNNPYGENLFMIDGGRATPAQAVAHWTDESRNYDYRLNACRGGQCGHYTQVVWRDTRRVGCAVAKASFREVWVCNYDPPGNIVGRRPY